MLNNPWEKERREREGKKGEREKSDFRQHERLSQYS